MGDDSDAHRLDRPIACDKCGRRATLRYGCIPPSAWIWLPTTLLCAACHNAGFVNLDVRANQEA